MLKHYLGDVIIELAIGGFSMYRKKQTSLEEIGIVETLMSEPINEEAIDSAVEAQNDAPLSSEEEYKANVELLNTSVENVGLSIRKIFVNNEYFNTILERLHSDSWNKLSIKERKQKNTQVCIRIYCR